MQFRFHMNKQFYYFLTVINTLPVLVYVANKSSYCFVESRRSNIYKRINERTENKVSKRVGLNKMSDWKTVFFFNSNVMAMPQSICMCFFARCCYASLPINTASFMSERCPLLFVRSLQLLATSNKDVSDCGNTAALKWNFRTVKTFSFYWTVFCHLLFNRYNLYVCLKLS